MTNMGLAADIGTTVIALAGVALLLFFLAIWSGRWGVWLAGYLFVIVALAVALLSGNVHPVHLPDDDAGAQEDQPVPGFGVDQRTNTTGTGHRL
jgi:membrane protein implicated in regulation of membrane protease activity